MSKDYKILTVYIMESIELIEKYTKNISEEDFTRSIQVQDAVARRLEIIGEAIGKFPKEIKKQNPDVRWDEIYGMRNFLIHEYFGVSVHLVWNTVLQDIPKLKEQMKRIK
jgi:uncharacterized protein with HEPN domain